MLKKLWNALVNRFGFNQVTWATQSRIAGQAVPQFDPPQSEAEKLAQFDVSPKSNSGAMQDAKFEPSSSEIHQITAADLPDVTAIRDMSDEPGCSMPVARMLVRFRNGREFLVTLNNRVKRFEVMYRVKTKISLSTEIVPCYSMAGVLEYLLKVSSEAIDESSFFLPLEGDVEKQIRKRWHQPDWGSGPYASAAVEDWLRENNFEG